MSRPPGYEWEPLQFDTDPVPGDVDAIIQEIGHLHSVADTIRQQITDLTRIADGGVEVGKHAEAIRSSAATVADSLGPAPVRYEKVASALTTWAEGLGLAQGLSLVALGQAEGPYETLLQAGAGFFDGQLIIPTNIASQPAVQEAKSEHEAAVRLLDQAIADRDNAAASCANAINAACDDALKDSMWRRFENDIETVGHDIETPIRDFNNDVGQVSWLLKDIAEGLEIVSALLVLAALVVAVVMVLVGGGGEAALAVAGVLTALAEISLEAALAIRLLLSLTGHGSWADVAIDAVSLLMFQLGEEGFSDAKAALKVVTDAGDAEVIAEKAASETGQTIRWIDSLMDDKDLEPAPIFRELALGFKEELTAELNETYQTATQVAEEAEAGVGRIIASGDAEGAKVAAESAALGERLAADTAEMAEQIRDDLNLGRIGAYASLGIGAAGLGLSGFPVYGPDGWHWQLFDLKFWERVEDDTTVPLTTVLSPGVIVFEKVKSWL